MTIPESNSCRGDVLIHLNEYVGENIRFADTKAAFAVTIVSVVVAAIFTKDVEWQKVLFGNRTSVQPYVAWAFSVMGTLSLMLGVWVVFPRTSHKPQRGLIFWENVTQYRDASAFSDAFMNTSEANVLSLLSQQHYHLSLIAVKKFRVLRWLLLSTCLTVVLGVFNLILLPKG